jgi:hypothetical protein
VAEKVHFAEELAVIAETATIDGIIDIRRHPVEAILSHIGSRSPLRPFGYRRLVEKTCRQYFDLVMKIEESPFPRLTVGFEELTSDNPEVFRPEVERLIAFLGERVLADRAEVMRAKFQEIRAQSVASLLRPASSTSSTHHRAASDPASVRIVSETVGKARATLAT